MYLPRGLIAHLYAHLARTHRPLAAPVLLLVALEPDALCACRILAALLRRDFIPHTIQPIAGYADLARAGERLVRPMRARAAGGVGGGVVVCLGVGGLVDLAAVLGLRRRRKRKHRHDDDRQSSYGYHAHDGNDDNVSNADYDGADDDDNDDGAVDDLDGVEIWVVDARRPWNLGNVFGGGARGAALLDDGTGGDGGVGVAGTSGGPAEAEARRPGLVPGVEDGRIMPSYTPGRGGIIVFDDGDIEEGLAAEREAYCALQQMPELGSDDDEDDDDDEDGEDGNMNGDGEDDGVNGNGVDRRCEIYSPDDDATRPTRKRKSPSDEDEDDDAAQESDEQGPVRPRRRQRTHESAPKSAAADDENDDEDDDSTSDGDDDDNDDDDDDDDDALRPSSRRRRRKRRRRLMLRPPSRSRVLRRRLRRLRRKHEATLQRYYDLGNSYSEPVSSLMYSLASELGREDNDLLWLAIIGVGSLDLYGRSTLGVGVSSAKDDYYHNRHYHAVSNGHAAGSAAATAGRGGWWGGERMERIRQLLRDEVRRLNPPALTDAHTNRHNISHHSQPSTARVTGEGGGIVMITGGSGGDDGGVGSGPTDGSGGGDIIPTHARSPTDTAIRLSPEPRLLLIRHWSLYDSMLHSPFLAARLRVWSAAGRRRLHKLLAKMGISLAQCRQSYTHMDMQLKRGLRARLLRYAPMYGLDGLVPPDAGGGGATVAPAAAPPNSSDTNDSHGRRKSGKGGGSGNAAAAAAVANARHGGWGFVRNWGFKACLSASDVGVIVGALLEVGRTGRAGLGGGGSGGNGDDHQHRGVAGQRGARHKGPDGGGGNESNAGGGGGGGGEEDGADGIVADGDGGVVDVTGKAESEEWVARFWQAYDALENVDELKAALPLAMHLHRAILRTGTALLEKRQLQRLRAFRMAVVKEGPDVALFTHPGALTKLALWLGEALAAQEDDNDNDDDSEGEEGGKKGRKRFAGGSRQRRDRHRRGGAAAGAAGAHGGTPLVVAALNERRGVYVVVGTGRSSRPTTLPSPATSTTTAARSKGRGKRRGGGGADDNDDDSADNGGKAKRKNKSEKGKKGLGGQGEGGGAMANGEADAEGDDNGADGDDRDDDSGDDEVDDQGESVDGDDDDDDDEEEEEEDGDEEEQTHSGRPQQQQRWRRGYGLNRFGNAFQEAVDETQARVRLDSFEHCVVDVRIADLATFLESLSTKAVVG